MASPESEAPQIDPNTQRQWRETTVSYYPNTLTKTFCVPPLHFNRVPYDFATVSGQVVLVSLPTATRNETIEVDGSQFFPHADAAVTTASAAANAATSTGDSKTNSAPDGKSKDVRSGSKGSKAKTKRAHISDVARDSTESQVSNTGAEIPSTGTEGQKTTKVDDGQVDNSGIAEGVCNSPSLSTEISADGQNSTSGDRELPGTGDSKTAKLPGKKNSRSKAQKTDRPTHDPSIDSHTTTGQQNSDAEATTDAKQNDAKAQKHDSGASPAGEASGNSTFNPWHPEKVPKPGSKPPKVSPFHVQSDFAQQHILANLKKLGEQRNEAMFIVSELDFKEYLNKSAYNKATAKLPKPTNMDRKLRQKGYHRGDFDIIIFSHKYGILVGELKSVGKDEKNLEVDLVKKRVKEALDQVVKEGEVVRHLVSDVAPDVPVRRTLFLPYVSSSQLCTVLQNNPPLAEQMLQSLEASDVPDAVQMCVCADQLSEPGSYWNVTPSSMSKLTTWWVHRMAFVVDTQLTDSQYLDIVARFVGPATTVRVHCTVTPRLEVRTEGEAIAELGRRISSLVLTPQQLSILNRNLPKVCICGPPGTGKTLMLVLQGLRWLREGLDVHVVSTEITSITAAFLIRHQLEMTIKDTANSTPTPKPGKVYLHRYAFSVTTMFPFGQHELVPSVVRELVNKATKGTLCLLIDEGHFNYSSAESTQRLRFIELLANKVPDFRVWCTCQFYAGLPPEHVMSSETVTTPLRSAPAVLREVAPAVDGFYDCHNYSNDGFSAPGDGLEVISLYHQGEGHECQWPLDCFTCGKNVADKLHQLGVGRDTPLRYSDVFILTEGWIESIIDNPLKELPEQENKLVVEDLDGTLISSTIGFFKGLLAAQVPVCYLRLAQLLESPKMFKRKGKKSKAKSMTKPLSVKEVHQIHDSTIELTWMTEKKIEDMVRGVTNRVVIADIRALYGMERKIVVDLPGRPAYETSKALLEVILKPSFHRHQMGREYDFDGHWNSTSHLKVFHGWSRCTTQLVMVEIPPKIEDMVAFLRSNPLLMQKFIELEKEEERTRSGPGALETTREDLKRANHNQAREETAQEKTGLAWAPKGFLSQPSSGAIPKRQTTKTGTDHSMTSSKELKTSPEKAKVSGTSHGEMKPDAQIPLRSTYVEKRTDHRDTNSREDNAQKDDAQTKASPVDKERMKDDEERKEQKEGNREKKRNGKDDAGVSWARKGFLL